MKKDAKSYQALYDLAEQARQDERLRLALQSAKNGEPAEPADQVLTRLRKKHIKPSRPDFELKSTPGLKGILTKLWCGSGRKLHTKWKSGDLLSRSTSQISNLRLCNIVC